jgi:CheY-like chemotaxis protein
VEETSDGYLLRFDVRDTGQGIRQEDLHRLFEAFSQVDLETNHSKEGTGLGLTISSDFIAMMGGQLSVESEYGKGSDFYFTIRQGLAPDSEETLLEEDTPVETRSFTAPSAHILIVDDTELNLVTIESLLEPLGMKIDTVTSGDQALSMIAEKHYDLIFMDYMMPYMDGVETTRRIRKLSEPYYQTLPIIVLSADLSEQTLELFQQAGIQAYAEKPVVYDTLMSLLLTWLPGERIIFTD